MGRYPLRRSYAVSGVYLGAVCGCATTAWLVAVVVGCPVWIWMPLAFVTVVCAIFTKLFLLWCDSTDAP